MIASEVASLSVSYGSRNSPGANDCRGSFGSQPPAILLVLNGLAQRLAHQLFRVFKIGSENIRSARRHIVHEFRSQQGYKS